MKKILRTVSLVALLGCLFSCNNPTSSSVSSSSSTQSISSVETSTSESSESTSEESSLSESTSEESLSSEESSSEESLSSEESSSETVVEATGVTLDQTAVTLKITKDVANPTVTLVATVAPENATDKTVTWETSDAAVATVADGVVTGLKYGTATITVKKGDFTATCEVTVETELPEPVVTTIAELTEPDETKLVKVTGIVDNVVNTSYGNFDLVDKDTGASMYVYGLGAKETAKQDFSWKNGKLSYKNPKSFASLDVKAGDEITMVGVFLQFGGNTLELSGYLDVKGDSSAYRYTASVEVNDATMGSATLSKTTDIAYGETVEILPAPADGYKVGKVEANGKEVFEAEGKYTFTAGVVNTAKVTFVEAAAAPVYTIAASSASTFGMPATSGESSTDEKTFDYNGITFGYLKIYSGGQYFMFYKPGTIYNKVAFPQNIAKVSITTSSGTSVKSKLYCSFGTEAMTANKVDTEGKTIAKNSTYDFVPAEASTYFNVSSDTAANLQITQIVITLAGE